MTWCDSVTYFRETGLNWHTKVSSHYKDDLALGSGTPEHTDMQGFLTTHWQIQKDTQKHRWTQWRYSHPVPGCIELLKSGKSSLIVWSTFLWFFSSLWPGSSSFENTWHPSYSDVLLGVWMLRCVHGCERMKEYYTHHIVTMITGLFQCLTSRGGGVCGRGGGAR